MLLTKTRKRNRSKVKLLGAVQINNTSFFVCKNQEGKVCLKTGQEEKLQKALLQKMIDLLQKVNSITSRALKQ